MIDGQKINLGGKEYVVPPLNFKAVKKLSSKIAELGSLSGVLTADQVDTIAEVVSFALQRNYPEMTVEAVMEVLDLQNVRPVFMSILGASGFVEKKTME